MSNNTSFDYELQQTEDLGEVLPETEAVLDTPKKSKNVATRLFSVIVAAICAAALFLPVYFYNGAFEQIKLLNVLIGLFNGEATFTAFGVLPCYVDAAASFGNLITAMMLYVLALCLVLAVIFALIGIFSGKACALRTATFFVAFGFLGYALHTAILSNLATLDLVSIAIAAVGLLIYFVLSAIKVGKKAWAALLQLILTLGATAMVGVIMANDTANVETAFANLGILSFDILCYILLGLFAFIILLGALRLQQNKGLGFDLVRYILQLVAAAVVLYLELTVNSAFDNIFFVYSIVAAGVSLVQIVICIIQLSAGKKKKVVPVVEEPIVEEAPVVEYEREEFAEALPYEGGPVEGVEVAEEVVPTYTAPMPEVQTAGYDFYNSKSFDPFIAVLNNDERNQFTEIFILKYRGVMPELPDYVVGGDNKEFFRKIFIYLGQYRDRIPDSLLAKMYQFAIKM